MYAYIADKYIFTYVYMADIFIYLKGIHTYMHIYILEVAFPPGATPAARHNFYIHIH